MPKFEVKLMREVWEQAFIVVEATDEAAAEATALQVCEDEKIELEWTYDETHSVDVISVEPTEQNDEPIYCAVRVESTPPDESPITVRVVVDNTR